MVPVAVQNSTPGQQEIRILTLRVREIVYQASTEEKFVGTNLPTMMQELRANFIPYSYPSVGDGFRSNG